MTIDLTRGIPPTDVFPVDDLILCGEAALKRDASILLQYRRSPGYPPLLDWIAERHGAGRDEVTTGNGSLELISFAWYTCGRPGARAFVEAPSYDRTITLLRRCGAQVVGIPTAEDGLDVDALKAELAKGVPALMYLVTDFQNPTGATMSLEKRQQVAALAKELGFWIVEDAPYRPLRYSGNDVPSMRSLLPERVLYLSSFSKIIAPGLRLAYLIGPSQQVHRLVEWAVDTYIGPVMPTQGMVYEYCRRGLLEPNLERLRTLYRPRLQATVSALKRYLPEATWTRPEGGFFVGVYLPAGISITELRKRAADAGVKLSDGRGFFPNPVDGDRFLRIPFCSVTPDEIEAGLSTLARVL